MPKASSYHDKIKIQYKIIGRLFQCFSEKLYCGAQVVFVCTKCLYGHFCCQNKSFQWCNGHYFHGFNGKPIEYPKMGDLVVVG